MTASLLEQLADLPKAEVDALIRAMAPGEANAFEYDWRYRARPEQLPPAGIWGAIQQPCRSLSRGAALIVIVLLSLGLWGIIWLAVALLASIRER